MKPTFSTCVEWYLVSTSNSLPLHCNDLVVDKGHSFHVPLAGKVADVEATPTNEKKEMTPN